MTREPERTPSVDQLRHIRDLLVRLRFEAENCGMWPGAETLPILEGRTYLFGVESALAYEFVSIFKPKEHTFGYGFAFTICSWPVWWLIELEEIGRSLEAFLASLGDHLTLVGELIESPGPDFTICVWGGSVAASFEPISTASAAVLVRCVRRLDDLLSQADRLPQSQPEPPFIPTEEERKILDALRGRDLTLDALAAATGLDRSAIHRRHLRRLREQGLVMLGSEVGQKGVHFFRTDVPPTCNVPLRKAA